MKQTKYNCVFFILLFILNNQVIGQSNNSLPKKKGIYRNAEEFLNNTPSVKDSFLIKYIIKDKQDPTIIGARIYHIDTTYSVNGMWGFSDGTSFFIRFPQEMFNDNSCMKLDYIGTLSYFTGIQKSVVAFGPTILSKLITAAATSLTSEKEYITFMIDHKGKVKYLHEDYLIKYFKEFPELLASFKKDLEIVFPNRFYTDDHFITEEECIKKDILLKEYLIKYDIAKAMKNSR